MTTRHPGGHPQGEHAPFGAATMRREAPALPRQSQVLFRFALQRDKAGRHACFSPLLGAPSAPPSSHRSITPTMPPSLDRDRHAAHADRRPVHVRQDRCGHWQGPGGSASPALQACPLWRIGVSESGL